MKKVLDELAVVTLFRSRARIHCPAVKIVAVPNAAKRGQKAMNQARREGAAWGFPDMMAIAPGRIAFIEFKREKGGRVSANQSDWMALLHSYGFPCGVFNDAGAALDFLRFHGFPFLFAEAA